MTLSDLERRNARNHFFGGPLLLRSYRLTENDCMWQGNSGERAYFYGVATPRRRGPGPQRHQNFCDPTYAHTVGLERLNLVW